MHRLRLSTTMLVILTLVLSVSLGIQFYESGNTILVVPQNFISVAISGPDSLGIGEIGYYSAIIKNESLEFSNISYSWKISPANNLTIIPENSRCKVFFNKTDQGPYIISIQVTNSKNSFGSANKLILGPKTQTTATITKIPSLNTSYSSPTPSPIVSSGQAGTSYNYLIKSDGALGYDAVEGKTGDIVYTSGDASTVINAALSDIVSGGVVHISEGNYYCNSEIVLRYNYSILEGEGACTVLIPTGGLIGPNASLIHDIGVFESTVYLSYCTVRDLAIDGDNIVMSHGIWFRKAYDCGFENVNIHDFTNFNALGYRGGALDLGADTYRCFINSCSSKSCYAEEGDFHSAGYDSRISNCESFNSKCHGILTPRNRGVVSNNIIVNSAVYGLIIEGPVTVSGNSIYNCSQGGIYVRNREEMIGCVIAENIIQRSGYDGIRADKGNVTMIGNYISENSKNSLSSGGIKLINASHCIIIGNHVFDDQTIKSQTYGIFMTGSSDYNIIAENDLIGNKEYALKGIVGSSDKIYNNIGFISENKGFSAGTGVQQSIPHGCSFIPTSEQVILSERTTGGASAYQSAPPDANYIYITAIEGKDYSWSVSFNP